MKRNRKRAVGAISVVGISAVAFIVGRALAGGIPATNAMSYAGTLEDAAGTLLTGTHNVEVKLWNVATGGAMALCTTNSQSVALQNGRFSLPLPDTCTAAVKANADVWVEVLDGGSSLGRTKVGAVPFAVEAEHAQTATVAGTASGTLAGQVVPPGLIGMFASTCPGGWVICDGSGSCPNLNGAYVKAGTSYAAVTGVNTHTHTVAASTSGAAGAHTHTPSGPTSLNGRHSHNVPLNWAGGSSSYIFAEYTSGNYWSLDKEVTIPSWRSTDRFGLGNPQELYQRDSPAGSGIVTNIEPAHSHTLPILSTMADHQHTTPSAQTASTNHEPTHATLVFCMKS